MFDHIINWELKSGSHDFPGPNGGTCINEAAIVAAGFEYRSISSARDCPPCFSRPVSAYAIRLNDLMPDDARNRLLMPFVTRLAGTADTPEIELARARFMVTETVRRILPISCRTARREDLAVLCERVTSFDGARDCARFVRDSLRFAAAACAADAAAYAADAAAYAAAYAVDHLQIWQIAVEILDGAIKLGRHDELPTEIAVQRMREKISA